MLGAMRVLAAVAMVATLSACATGERVSTKDAEITMVVVQKAQRKMYLLSDGEVVRKYPIALGYAPEGPKRFEGDGRTPEGVYYIDRRNPDSRFHLSLGISYPSPRDVQIARAAGRSPGGDIFIHGWRRSEDPKTPDWTWGCIAVKDRHIEEIFGLVQTGTPIVINP